VRSTGDASADFLRLFIQAEIGRLNQSAGGGMFASITAKNLRGFLVLVPPLAEQQRIVETVGAVDVHVAALKAQTDAARAVRAGVLADLLSGGRPLDEFYDKEVDQWAA